MCTRMNRTSQSRAQWEGRRITGDYLGGEEAAARNGHREARKKEGESQGK